MYNQIQHLAIMKIKKNKIIEVIEKVVIILIIILSLYSLKSIITKDFFSISFTNFKDSEFSIISKQDALSIKTAIPSGHINYISDTKCESFCIIFQQYILAPVFIDYDSMKNAYTFGTFTDPIKALEAAQKNNLEIIKQNGNFYFFKTKK